MSLAGTPDRLLATLGRPMTLRRRIGTGATFTDVLVQGYLTAFSPDRLTGGVQQGDATVTIGPSTGAISRPQKGDMMLIDGRTWSLMGVEEKRVGATLAGYKLWVRGG